MLTLALLLTLAHAGDAPAPEAPEEVEELTPLDLDAAAERLETIESEREAVDAIVKRAERRRDEENLACVRSRQRAISSLEEVARDALEEGREALAVDALETAAHELHKVDVAERKVRQLRREVEACGPPRRGRRARRGPHVGRAARARSDQPPTWGTAPQSEPANRMRPAPIKKLQAGLAIFDIPSVPPAGSPPGTPVHRPGWACAARGSAPPTSRASDPGERAPTR